MSILEELEKEIKQCEKADTRGSSAQNRISILRSILKIKKNENMGVAYKKMLYLLMVKICLVLIDLQRDGIIDLDLSDLDMIATKLGNPEISLDELTELIGYFLDDRYAEIYSIIKMRDEFISLIYERLVLERRR